MESAARKIFGYLQRKTRLDFRYYWANSKYLFAQQVISLTSALLLAVIFARYLSRQTYGQYQLILAIIGMISFVSVPGISNAAFGALSRGYDGVFLKGLKIRLRWSLWGIPLLFAVGGYYSFYKDQPTLGLGFVIAACFFPFRSTLGTWSTLLQAKKNFKTNALYGSILAILNTALLTAAVLLGNGRLIPLVLVYLVSFSVLNSLALKNTLGFIDNDKEESGWEGYGYFLTKINVLAVITGRLDHILVGSLLGLEELAVYAIGVRFAKVIQDLLTQLLTLTTPKIARSDTLDKKKYTLAFLTTLIGSVFLILITPAIMKFLFTSRYDASIYLSQVIFAFLPFFVINNIYQKHFKYYVKNRNIIFGSHIISPLVRSALLLVAVSAYGISGVALVQGSRSILYILISFFLSKHFLTKELRKAE